MCSCRSADQKCGGIVCTARVLQWLDVGSKSSRLGWPRVRVDLHVGEQSECMEFCLEVDKPAKCLQVRIRGQIIVGDIVC